jgi:hypothetical protein
MVRPTSVGSGTGGRFGALLVLMPLAIGCGGQDHAPPSETGTVAPSLSLHIEGPGVQAAAAMGVSQDLVTIGGSYADGFMYDSARFGASAGIDGFVLGLGQHGELRFAKQLSGSGDDAILAAEIDPFGYSVIAGRVTSGAELGGQSLSERTEWTALVARLDASGELDWAVSSTGSGLHSTSAVAVGEDGSIYAAGDFIGELNLGGQSLTASNDADGFLARFSEQGELLWLRAIGGPGPQDVRQLAVDSDGTVLVAGGYAGTLSIASVQRESIETLDRTPFLARFHASGELGWLQTKLLPPPPEDHSQHPPGEHEGGHSMHTALGSVSFSLEPSGELAAVVSYGRFFGLHGEDFEAPAISSLSVSRVGASGELLARKSTSYPNSLFQVGALLPGSSGSRLAASWSGEVDVGGRTLTSPAPRSLLFSQLAGGEALNTPRHFSVPGIALTSQTAALSGDSIWVTARWIDPDSNEHDVLVARFEP